jgi:DNA polymerase-4
MAQQARGIDDRPLVLERPLKSVSQERTFRQDLADLEVLLSHLQQLSLEVSQRLEQSSVVAATIAIKLRYSDFTTHTRQISLTLPTSDAGEIYRAAAMLFRRAWPTGRPLRLLGVAGLQLTAPCGQLTLPLFEAAGPSLPNDEPGPAVQSGG